MRKTCYLCYKNWNANMLLDTFRDYLKKYRLDMKQEDDTITFYYDDCTYLFIADNSDQNYFRLIRPNVDEITDISRYYSVINSINRDYKAVKIYTVDSEDNNNSQIWIAIEQFVYSEIDIDALFGRCLYVLSSLAKILKEEIDKVGGVK